MFKYEKYFPFAEIRDAQRNAIEFVLNKFINEKKKFVILEAGTGVGKSAIAICVARYMREFNKEHSKTTSVNNAYILTTQKILQQQYVRDYSVNALDNDDSHTIPDIEDAIISLQSSENFKCDDDPDTTCGQVMKLNKHNKSDNKSSCGKNCKYKKLKAKFLKSDGVTNFSYFLSQITYNSEEFCPRKLLIVDEAHNCDNELSKFIQIYINDELITKYSLPMPSSNSSNNNLYDWIKSIYNPKLISIRDEVQDALEQNINSSRLENLTNELATLNNTIDSNTQFIKNYTEDNWVCNINTFEDNIVDFEFKPIQIKKYANSLLFNYGDQVLLMSATIIDYKRFCKLNGIRLSESSYLFTPSPFPIKNKPILYYPVGSMSQKNLNDTLPKLVRRINKILSKHDEEKGIIHCHSYFIGKFIKNNSKFKSRLLLHTSKNRDKVLFNHIKSTKNTVLLSPSMSEGVDLKDDISRFQIICKLPYPFLGDTMVQKKKDAWDWWYNYETTKTIVQSLGRSIRTEKDYAVTYILDNGWSGFFNENSKLFPPGFKEQFVKPTKK